jgi:hypothetical protein
MWWYIQQTYMYEKRPLEEANQWLADFTIL